MNFVFDSNVDALKQVHVYTRQGERAHVWVAAWGAGEQGGERCMLESTSYVLPCHLEVCWQVLQLVMGQYREAELESPTVSTAVRGLWKKKGKLKTELM